MWSEQELSSQKIGVGRKITDLKLAELENSRPNVNKNE